MWVIVLSLVEMNVSIREMSVSGYFYPDECREIEDSLGQKQEFHEDNIRALIAPHAGYIYSGEVAKKAYQKANISIKKAKRVIIIGPTHKVYFQQISVALYDEYKTPCGLIEIDLEYSKSLIEKFEIVTFEDALHHEHSTETQAPFIKKYAPNASVVEIVYGQIDYIDLVPIIENILDDEENFLIISTDLSHFYNLNIAHQKDQVCIEAIEQLDIEQFENGCEACGMIGVKSLIKTAKNNSLNAQIIDYSTSYDTNGDEASVVGYLSVIITKNIK